MPLSTIAGDLYVQGALVAQSFRPPTSSIGDDAVDAAAGIDATKLQHQHQLTAVICDHATDCPSAKRMVIHRVYGEEGTLVEFGVVASVAAGATTTVTIDLLKNGTTVLSSTISLTNAVAAFEFLAAAGFTSADLVAGDVLEVSVSLSGSNEPKGVTCILTVREDAL